MPVVTRQIGPCFAAEVDGIDMTRPLSSDEVKAIHAGMDRYAVLVFHGQMIDDDQQLAFTKSLAEIELAVGTSLRAPDEYRLPTTFADVSNLDQNHKVFARDDRRRLFALGNRLWHSDSSFKVVPAKYSLLHARAPLLPPRPGRARDPAGVRVLPQVAGGRPRDVGQPPDDAPRPALSGARAARHAPYHAQGRRADGGPSRRLRRPETSTRG